MGKMTGPFFQDVMSATKDTRQGQPRFYVGMSTVRSSRLHYHEFGELSLFVEGNGSELINGVRHRIQPGTVSLVLPSHMHVIDSDPEYPLRKYSVCFDMRLVFGLGDDDDFSSLLYGVGTEYPSFVDLDEMQMEQMKGIMEQLINEYVQLDPPGWRHMVRAKLTEALLLFVRNGNRGTQEEDVEDTSGQLWPILHYIHTHHEHHLTLDDLCQVFDLTASHISRLLKKHTGQGFVEYLHRLRIESAVALLRHTQLPITDIAYESGFESLNTFGRVFRKMKGMSPRQYRAMISQ